MADDEQFSLCWNNFNSNLSAGFHESLCRGDLVDVTLAAEGQFVKAHRLVLSVCSPYFRKMFTQMPANQHAFVFLKDVSHTALKDLIQFMYCGEVNVKQEALPAFISTAEALQIKGLTDGDPPQPQSPAEPAAPVTQVQQQLSSPRVRQQRTSTTRSYKIETVEDSDDNKQTTTQIVIAPAPQQTQTITTHHPAQQTAATTTTVVSQKRPAQRSIGSAHVKRTKSTIDPLEGADVTPTTQQITVQTAVVATSPAETKIIQHAQSETEYIDLPIELPTKSEPDYSEDVGGDVDGNDQDTAYVEDDSYGEMRYDDTYFTENEDGGTVSTGTGNVGGGATTSKAIVKQQQGSFTDSSYVDASDQTNNDAQVKDENSNDCSRTICDASNTNIGENITAITFPDTRINIESAKTDDPLTIAADITQSSLVKKDDCDKTSVKEIIANDKNNKNDNHQTVAVEIDAKSECKTTTNDLPVKIIDCDNIDMNLRANIESNKIPLHSGSRVYVSKCDLASIFVPDAGIYVSRLCELVFGVEKLRAVANIGTNLNEYLLRNLDKDILKSIITHVVQVFSKRGQHVDQSKMLLFIEHKLKNMTTSI